METHRESWPLVVSKLAIPDTSMWASVAVTRQVVSRLPCAQLSDSLTYQIHITIFGNSLRHS